MMGSAEIWPWASGQAWHRLQKVSLSTNISFDGKTLQRSANKSQLKPLSYISMTQRISAWVWLQASPDPKITQLNDVAKIHLEWTKDKLLSPFVDKLIFCSCTEIAFKVTLFQNLYSKNTQLHHMKGIRQQNSQADTQSPELTKNYLRGQKEMHNAQEGF